MFDAKVTQKLSCVFSYHLSCRLDRDTERATYKQFTSIPFCDHLALFQTFPSATYGKWIILQIMFALVHALRFN